MKRELKESFVAGFQDRVRSAPVFYLTDFSGLDVKSMTELRHRLRDAGAEYVVVKNRLVMRALRELEIEIPELTEHLAGPTGVVIAGESPVESAKALTDFAKSHQDRPVFKVGLVDNNIVAATQFERLAKLPPRDELLAQLAGALQAPLAAFVGVLEAKLQEAAGLLESLRAKKESEEN
jgi:large subunit ribosomal protein L10